MVCDGGLTLAKTIREPETSITGMLVLLASSFGCQDDRLGPTVAWLLGEQLDDGGWNCEVASQPQGSRVVACCYPPCSACRLARG